MQVLVLLKVSYSFMHIRAPYREYGHVHIAEEAYLKITP